MKLLLTTVTLLLTTTAVIAGDNAVGEILWPKQDDYAVSIPMGEIPHCTVTNDCCSVMNPCSVVYQRQSDPAPVPLPGTLLFLTAAIAALIWKGSYRV